MFQNPTKQHVSSPQHDPLRTQLKRQPQRKKYTSTQQQNKPSVNLDYEMGLDARKPAFGDLRTTQAQTSLRIRAV